MIPRRLFGLAVGFALPAAFVLFFYIAWWIQADFNEETAEHIARVRLLALRFGLLLGCTGAAFGFFISKDTGGQ